jgi:hypothetical protein
MTLHADTSPNDPADDWGQPFTRNYFDSDAGLLSQNSAFDSDRMRREYTEIMTTGIQEPRHAYMIEPTGDPGFINPTGNPAQGTNGGYSAGIGYGPYTLAPGESVSFVMIEAAAGLSREANEVIGRQYFQAGRDAMRATHVQRRRLFALDDEERVGDDEPRLVDADVPPRPGRVRGRMGCARQLRRRRRPSR